MSEQKNQTIFELLGVDELPESQKNEILKKFGSLIVEASVGQLLLELSPEKVTKLQTYIDNVSDEEDVVAYLLRTFPDFQPIIEREILALKTEIEAVYR